MNNAEIIKGIDLTLEGLKTIKNALAGDEVAPKSEPDTAKKEVAEAPVLEGTLEFDVEELKAMKYNEFKKLAASLGVKCTGTRDEIMARILALDNAVIVSEPVPVEEEDEEPVTAPAPKKVEKKAPAKAPKKDEFDEQAEAIAEETAVEDIIEALADVEIKATKKNAVEKLAYALREGLIEIEDEDEDSEEEDEEDIEEVEEDTADEEEADDDEEDEEEEAEIDASSYFEQFDPKGYNNPEKMSKKRAKAVVAKMKEILTAFYDEELTENDLVSYLEDNATDEELELLDDDYTTDDLLMFYMELVKRTIDNDGDEHEPAEPYEVADMDVCCGHELKYIKKTQKYVCEHCGTEYEAE